MDIRNKKELAKFLAQPSTFNYLCITAPKGTVLDFPGVRWVQEMEIYAEPGAVVNFPDLVLVVGDLVLRLEQDSAVRLPKLREVSNYCNFYDESGGGYDRSVDFACLTAGDLPRTVELPATFLCNGRPYSYSAVCSDLNRWFPIANDSEYVLSYNPAKQRVRAGCRYFTIKEGIKHWTHVANEYAESYSDPQYSMPTRGQRALMFVMALSNLKASLQQA